jgi:phenylalanyl-tRNA synthetase beta subunit
MKYSYQWLQSHIEEKLPTPESLKETIIFHAFEVESIEIAGDDTVFDIKVLPDRAGDCLSHYGIARELAGLLKLTLKEKTLSSLPDISESGPAAVPTVVSLELKSDLCRKYLAIRIDGVQVGPSPEWLKQKLEAIGQRSINNIVDATNYVLNDIGQPIHAFDAGKVDGGIVVRLAHEGEKIKLLGATEEKTLSETDLVIADYLGAIAIAGVKGGATAEVDEKTTSVIVEVASFDPIAIRKTSRRLGLITDASKRFENNFSQTFVQPAAAQVVALILELAGGTVSAIREEGIADPAPRSISFNTADVTRLLGNTISAASIDEVLTRYRYTYAKEGDTYTLSVPSWRADIIGAHDIAEEVGRVIGYDTIPATMLPDSFAATIEPNETDLQISAVRAWAIQHGYREAYTYTFRSKGDVVVSYGAKGKDKLRTNLSDGLQESYELNRLNAPLLGIRDVQLFEVGTVFSGDKEEVHVAVCDKGSIQELPIADFIQQKNIDTTIVLDTDKVLNHAHAFVPWSVYPFIARDIAVWVTGEDNKEKLETIVSDFAFTHCTRPPYLFDTFTKDGRTSVAYRFIFQSFEKTLTDEEVAASFKVLTDQIAADDAFELR